MAAPEHAIPARAAARPRRRFGWRRALALLAAILALLVVALGAFAFYMIRHSLPTTDGALTLPGLSAPVTVTRDQTGAPHLTAANSDDLFRAQGYVVSQDRLWQMDFYRRVGAGRLAEVLGEPALDVDRFARTIGWRRAAQRELDSMPAPYRTILQDYADGVNAFLAAHEDSLPLEFSILGYKPEPWTPLDTVTFGKVQSWSLGENLDIEITMADLQAKLGPERAASLLPAYPDGKPTIVTPSALKGGAAPAAATVAGQLRALFGGGAGGDPVGSNNWVIGPARSADGHPLLANDPHLGVANPSIWYAMGLRATDGSLDVTGVTFTGAPGIIVGHNRDVAWGLTNLGPDTEDLFVETLDPAAHPGEYLFQGEWRPLDIITETIRVKGLDPVSLIVRSTEHGPLLDSVRDDIQQPAALQWAALETTGTLQAVIDLDRARDWDTFHAALAHWAAPGQNFVYADTQGNIGYQATGAWPIRKAGNGLTPVDGAGGAYEWTGYVPYETLPRLFNPPQGYIATANNRVVGPEYPQLITAWWFPWYRAERISQMIESKPKLSVDDVKAMQYDTHDLLAVDISKHLAALTGGDARTQEAVARFKGWDANILAGSATAALYEITYRRLLTDTFADELGGPLAAEYLNNAGHGAAMLLDKLVEEPDNAWWDDLTTPAHETRDDILRKSVQEAVVVLTDRQGADMNAWNWGALRTITFNHTLGSVQPLDRLFNFGPYPTSGDAYTVNVGGITEDPDHPYTYTQRSHASMRMINDTGDWTKGQLVFSPGESGQPGSAHWGDQVDDWLKGVYHPLLWTDEQIRAQAEGTLTLRP
jgi:penicillin G amidase